MLIDFSSIVKQAFFAYVAHARIRSWNQPVLSNVGNVSCSRKQSDPLMGLELTTIHRLRIRRWRIAFINTLVRYNHDVLGETH